VVQDVVYNHTFASGPYSTNSVLDKIVPGYYHRRQEDGEICHSTCCNSKTQTHSCPGADSLTACCLTRDLQLCCVVLRVGCGLAGGGVSCLSRGLVLTCSCMSCCAPDTASEHRMFERLTIDDLVHWARDYKVSATNMLCRCIT
jgi:hypothetical protein